MDVGIDYDQPPEPGEKIPEPPKKDSLQDKAVDAGKEAVKKKLGLKALANLALKRAGAWLAGLAAAYGWPVIVALLVIAILLFLFSAAFGGGLIAISEYGYLGKTYPKAAGADDPNIKAILQASQTPSRVEGFDKVNFQFADDKTFLEQGKIDYRLARALVYLSNQHEMININEIIHDYQYMDTNEAGTDTNPQIIKNISAHKDGLAADINQIDFVYKVIDENSACGTAADIVSGADVPVGDIVYYNDLDEELLRLPCADIGGHSVNPNTTWDDLPAEGIPIKIADQDCKPNIQHAGNLPDPCTTITDPTDILVYQKVSQPEARRKTHAALAELLQFPYQSGDTNLYKITQLITFSNERDVKPFQDDGTLDALYGLPRPANIGLFWLLEAWQNIHIGY